VKSEDTEALETKKSMTLDEMTLNDRYAFYCIRPYTCVWM